MPKTIETEKNSIMDAIANLSTDLTDLEICHEELLSSNEDIKDLRAQKKRLNKLFKQATRAKPLIEKPPDENPGTPEQKAPISKKAPVFNLGKVLSVVPGYEDTSGANSNQKETPPQKDDQDPNTNDQKDKQPDDTPPVAEKGEKLSTKRDSLVRRCVDGLARLPQQNTSRIPDPSTMNIQTLELLDQRINATLAKEYRQGYITDIDSKTALQEQRNEMERQITAARKEVPKKLKTIVRALKKAAQLLKMSNKTRDLPAVVSKLIAMYALAKDLNREKEAVEELASTLVDPKWKNALVLTWIALGAYVLIKWGTGL
jgi:hypothetical protein